MDEQFKQPTETEQAELVRRMQEDPELLASLDEARRELDDGDAVLIPHEQAMKAIGTLTTRKEQGHTSVGP